MITWVPKAIHLEGVPVIGVLEIFNTNVLCADFTRRSIRQKLADQIKWRGTFLYELLEDCNSKQKHRRNG